MNTSITANTSKIVALLIALMGPLIFAGMIGASPVILTSSPLPDGVVGSAYDQTLVASNGIPPYTWAIASNSLPAGLSLVTSTGEITGTPVVAAVSYFGVLVTDSTNQNYYGNYQMTVDSSPVSDLVVSPANDFISIGPNPGPYIPSNMVYTLSNNSGSNLDWSVSYIPYWLNPLAASGTLPPGGSTNVTFSIISFLILPGTNADVITFTNLTDGIGSTNRNSIVIDLIAAKLAVSPPPTNFTASGLVGGPFSPVSQVYTLTNRGQANLLWSASNSQPWLSVSQSNGILPGSSSTVVTVSIGASATNLLAGNYSDTVIFTNLTNGSGSTTRLATLTIIYPFPSNSWISAASGNWNIASDWSLGLAPSNNQSIFITNASFKTVTISSNPTPITDLIIAAPVGASNTLSMSSLGLSAPLQILNTLQVRTGGVVGIAFPYLSAIVVDTGGTNAGTGVITGSNIVYSLTNGVTVGFNSQGTLRLNGGSMAATYTDYVGYNPGSSGTLTVEGGTDSLAYLQVGMYPGATGTVWITGGATVTCPDIGLSGYGIGPMPSGVGQLTISNGSVTVQSTVTVGGFGVPSPGACGTLTIAGGTLNIGAPPASGGQLYIGYGGYANGTVWLTGGALIATNPSPGQNSIVLGASSQGNARLTVSNGVLLTRSLTTSFNGRIVLAGGTSVVSSNLLLSGFLSSTNVIVAGGNLYVTNAAAKASISLLTGGILLLTNGTITADAVTVTPNTKLINFGGTLTSKSTTISNGLVFTVGSATNLSAIVSTFVLNGGYHSFNNGLLITPFSLLTGCGTIMGVVTNNGTIALTCPTVFSNAVVNNATLVVSDGATVDFYGPVINNGLINAVNGTVNFHFTFVNNGIYLTTNGTSNFQITSITPLGDDVLIAWQGAGGETNVVQATTDPTGGYTNISPNIILSGNGSVLTNYLDTGGATNSSSRFYRISMVP